MPRIRYLKPDFFKDEDIANLPPLTQLCYQGLWVHADKAGRLEDRPRRLKAEIFPYRKKIDLDFHLRLLTKPKTETGAPFILRYAHQGNKYIQILKWEKHQKPHHTERLSEIPPPTKEQLSNGYTTVREQEGMGMGMGKSNIISQEPSAALQAALDNVYKSGLNIYSLIGRLKKIIKVGKGWHFPEEVLIEACEQYHKDKDKIKDEWPWFIKVIHAKSDEYFANKNIKENKARKQEGMPQAIKEIMADALKTKA